MEKDFKDWHNKKEAIDRENTRTFYHAREVWWCSIGLNVGFEQDGKGAKFSRPILILKGFSKEVFLAVPITTKNKDGKYYHEIDLKDGIKRKVILSQIRLFDAKRLQEKITMIDRAQFSEIKKAIIRIIG
jgi:mRNA interferase MazF